MKAAKSHKRLQISKAQATILKAVLISTTAVVFCLVSSKILLSQASYQRTAINARRDAAKQLEDNNTQAQQLVNQYNTTFASTSNLSNVLGGKNTDNPDAVPPDGDNPRIVLNALPSSYDFPALISSISKMLATHRITNPNIQASDQSATFSNLPSPNPQPVEIPITLSGTGRANDIYALARSLERSIRPYDVTDLQLRGSGAAMTFNVTMKTYYQPARSLTITDKTVN